MPQYKGYTIKKDASYKISNNGFVYSNASALVNARRQAKELEKKHGVPMEVLKTYLYHIYDASSRYRSTAFTLPEAKAQINRW